MTKDFKPQHVDLSESSIYGKNAEDETEVSDDYATEADLDRLETITGGADEPALYRGKLGRQVETQDASTAEEIDALEVNLMQDDALSNSRDGSGRIIDDVAEEQIAEFTEVGPDLDSEGAKSVVPGRDDTSAVLRRHHPASDRSEAIGEGNLDKPSDETREDGFADEGTAG